MPSSGGRLLKFLRPAYRRSVERDTPDGMARDGGGELSLVGKIQAQRCHRHIAAFDRPAIGALFRTLERHDGEPEVRAPHWIFAGNYFAVVMPDRLPRPEHTARHDRGQIDVDQG